MKKKKIKSTKVSLKFCNKNKVETLLLVRDEYIRLLNVFIQMIWCEGLEYIPTNLGRSYTDQIKDSTWLSARLIQACGKQASSIVRGNFRKQKNRIYIYEQKQKQGIEAKKLKEKIDQFKVSIPTIKEVDIVLDNRFYKVDLENTTSFDGWLHLSSLGDKLSLDLPFRKTRHFNKLQALGTMLNSIAISNKEVSFSFEMAVPELKKEGTTIGLDIGIKELFSSSDGQRPTLLNGHDMDSIINTLKRKKKGSKAFRRTQKLRENYINYCFNTFNLTGVRTLRREDIKYLRFGVASSRQLTHFNYPYIFDKLDDICTQQGVLVEKIDPTYTSQRCSVCGYTKKSNRNKKQFVCASCGHTSDADHNASINISLPLSPLTREFKQLKSNRTGFYWALIGQECIVPDCSKTNEFYTL